MKRSYIERSAFLQILQDGLNRSEVRDSFQTNVTTGVILSVPSLLFPSSNSPSPNVRLVKDATIALASRLAQVPHQEAVLKSLMKIRDVVGVEEFEGYLEDYDNKLKRNIEILSKIYNIKSSKRTQKKGDAKGQEKVEDKDSERKWESDSDTSGIAEEEEEINNGAMPAARVVLETEIKFNEETAITMTILEEKEDSEGEQDYESGTDVRNDGDGKDSSPDRRKTPRRVHFGGEVVKLRTPDSDETESLEAVPKTRIPVPVSPATKMPVTRPRPSSQPCSPRREPGKLKRASRSVSSSPKREVYTHNAELSPKKSILSRTSSPMVAGKAIEQTRKRKSLVKRDEKVKDGSKGEQTSELRKKEDTKIVQSSQSIGPSASSKLVSEDKSLSKVEKKESPLPEPASKKSNTENLKTTSSKLSEDSTVQGTKEMKEDKNYNIRERISPEVKTPENIQKKMEKVSVPESVHNIDSIFDSLVENEVQQTDHGYQDRFIVGDSKIAPNEVSVRDAEKSTLKNSVKVKQGIVEGESLRNVDGERSSRSDRDKESVIERNGSAANGDSEVEIEAKEPSWEELGLVDSEVLEDLHNKVSNMKYYFD